MISQRHSPNPRRHGKRNQKLANRSLDDTTGVQALETQRLRLLQFDRVNTQVLTLSGNFVDSDLSQKSTQTRNFEK